MLYFSVIYCNYWFFELHRRIAIWGTEVALGDYWMYLYGGMKEYIPTTGNPFQFPTMWIAVFCLVRLLF